MLNARSEFAYRETEPKSGQGQDIRQRKNSRKVVSRFAFRVSRPRLPEKQATEEGERETRNAKRETRNGFVG
jgi:hypothetical protein